MASGKIVSFANQAEKALLPDTQRSLAGLDRIKEKEKLISQSMLHRENKHIFQKIT